jgi:hypothetical protein
MFRARRTRQRKNAEIPKPGISFQIFCALREGDSLKRHRCRLVGKKAWQNPPSYTSSRPIIRRQVCQPLLWFPGRKRSERSAWQL